MWRTSSAAVHPFLFFSENQPAAAARVSVPPMSGDRKFQAKTPKGSVTLTCLFCSPEEEWSKLLDVSPLFQLLRGVETQLKRWAGGRAEFDLCGAGG